MKTIDFRETGQIFDESDRPTPPPPPEWFAAGTILFRKFLMVESMAVYGSNYPDPQGVQHILPVDASDAEIGAALLDALDKSRFLTPDQPEFDAFFGDWIEGRNDDAYDAGLMEVAGVKTRATLYRGARSVGVRAEGGDQILLTAWRRRRGRWFSGDGGGPVETLPRDTSPEALGAAWRRAVALAGD